MIKALGFILGLFGVVLALPGALIASVGLRIMGNRSEQPEIDPAPELVTIHDPDSETIERLSALAQLGAVGFCDPRSEWRMRN